MLCTLFTQAQTPCGDLFFSEYIEGSSSNKALEIYNPTGAAVDLTNYVLYRANNGSLTPTDSLFPQGMLADGDVYVIANPGAIPAIQAQMDTTHSLTFYNGDDAVWLKNLVTGDTLDIIGEIGVDPGSGWTVGTGATNNFTLIRMINIQDGELDWTIGATEWDVFPIDMTDSLGMHTMTPCGATLNPVVSFSIASQTVNENGISVDVDLQIIDENASPTSVDVVLNVGSSTATNGSDFTYTSPTTVTFPANSNATQTITISITDDAILEADEDIVIELSNPTNSASLGLSSHTITILDNELEPDFGSCSNLFFSEYIEGSSNNKVLEIYNPTCDTVDLANYQVQRFTNGSTSASGTYTFPTGTLLASQEVYVIANASSDPAILSVADTTNAATFFNGDDAVTLMDLSTGDTLDIIGVVGVDPGTGWTVGSGATNNHTLVRKPNIHDGTTDWSVSSTQWEVLTIDTFDSLGMHWATTCNTPVVPAFSVQDTTSCLGQTVCFTNMTTGGSCNLTYLYDLGEGTTATQEDYCHTYAAPGTYTVVLTVDDNGSTFTTSVAVTVLASSDATITAAGPFCEGDDAVNLTAVDAGGTWSGTGITDANAGTFDPATAGAGSFDIVYTISGTCGDADTLSVSVTADEIADIVYSDTVFCANLEAAITPTNNGDAGTFSGSTGLVIDANTGVIDGTSTIAGSGAGSYTVIYITNGTCADTVEVDIYLENCDALQEAGLLNFDLYPNPAQDVLRISGELNEILNIQIIDLAGKIVHEQNASFGQVALTGLAKGNYIILLQTKNGVAQQRFVKD